MNYAIIRSDYIFGPAVEAGTRDPDEADLFAGVSVDGWKTSDSDEQGEVIAHVLMSVHGDLIVDWHNNGARYDEGVLTAIREAKDKLQKLREGI